MAAKPRPRPRHGGRRAAVLAALAALFFWAVPLFHVVRPGARAAAARAPGKSAPAASLGAIADKFWRERLLPSSARAPDVAVVLAAAQSDLPAATERYAHKVGLGGLAYFYVSGEGRVVRSEADRIFLSVGPGLPVVALETGPVFGNTVRDGTGLIDVNDFSSLDEYNTLAAELDRLVGTRVLPALRQHARLGARIAFAGCAQVPEELSVKFPLAIVPVRAEVR